MANKKTNLTSFNEFILPFSIIIIGAVLTTVLTSLWAYDYGYATGTLIATQDLLEREAANQSPVSYPKLVNTGGEN